MADDDALFRKGMPIRREVLGPDYVDASMARADEFMMSFHALARQQPADGGGPKPPPSGPDAYAFGLPSAPSLTSTSCAARNASSPAGMPQ